MGKKSFTKPKTNHVAIETLNLRTKAVEMRIKRYSYEKIAKEIGVSPGYACKLVQAALDEARQNYQEKANELRDLELQSLDEMERPLWDKYEQKDEEMLATAHTILKVKDLRVKIAGLTKLEAPGEQTGTKIYVHVSLDDWNQITINQNKTSHSLPTLQLEGSHELTKSNPT